MGSEMCIRDRYKRATAHKVEAYESIYVLHEDAPILLADRVGIFLFLVMPVYVGQ